MAKYNSRRSQEKNGYNSLPNAARTDWQTMHGVNDVPKPAMHLDSSHTIELMVDNFRVKISNATDPKLLAEILRILKGQSC